MSTPTTVPELLDAALGEFDKRGWCTGLLEDPQGRVCALGAMNYALWGRSLSDYADKDRFQLRERAQQVLRRHIPTHLYWTDVIGYNNTRTSYNEVREWFEKARADERVDQLITYRE